MRNVSTMFSSLVVASLGLTACRDVPDDGGEPPPSTAVEFKHARTVAQVRSDEVKVNDPVDLVGVVVTAVDLYGGKKGNFFVADPKGGPGSGLTIFGVQEAETSKLAVGDVINVTGLRKVNYAASSDKSGRALTELSTSKDVPVVIAKAGQATPPAPTVLDAIELAKLDQAARDAEFEKWEGSVVTLQNIAAIGAPFGTDPVEIPMTSLNVNSSLGEFPAGLAEGACFRSITGVIDYFVTYKLMALGAPVFATGNACLPPERGALCQDEADNDFDGAKDCADPSCLADPDSGCKGLTIPELRDATATDQLVRVDKAIIVGRAPKGLWIAASADAKANQGIYVFTSAAPDAAWQVGAWVSVQGKLTDYDVGRDAERAGNSLRQLMQATITVLSDQPSVPVPMVITDEPVFDIDDGEAFESSLVTLAKGVVGETTGTGNKKRTKLFIGATTVLLSFDAGNVTLPASGTCVVVTGIMGLDLTKDVRTLSPRNAADVVTTEGCPTPTPTPPVPNPGPAPTV